MSPQFLSPQFSRLSAVDPICARNLKQSASVRSPLSVSSFGAVYALVSRRICEVCIEEIPRLVLVDATDAILRTVSRWSLGRWRAGLIEQEATEITEFRFHFNKYLKGQSDALAVFKGVGDDS